MLFDYKIRKQPRFTYIVCSSTLIEMVTDPSIHTYTRFESRTHWYIIIFSTVLYVTKCTILVGVHQPKICNLFEDYLCMFARSNYSGSWTWKH